MDTSPNLPADNESEPRSSEPQSGPDQSAAGTTAPTQPVSPKSRANFFHFLFDPQTRLGRFNRAALRVLATVVGLFALGVLASYLLLYRPLQNDLARSQADLRQANLRAARLENSLLQAQQERDALKQRNQELQQETDQAKRAALLYQALNDVNLARLALAQEDAVAAQQALVNTPATLLKLAAVTPAQQTSLVQSIQARINLVLSEIQTDPKTAASDLEILSEQFTELKALQESAP